MARFGNTRKIAPSASDATVVVSHDDVFASRSEYEAQLRASGVEDGWEHATTEKAPSIKALEAYVTGLSLLQERGLSLADAFAVMDQAVAAVTHA